MSFPDAVAASRAAMFTSQQAVTSFRNTGDSKELAEEGALLDSHVPEPRRRSGRQLDADLRQLDGAAGRHQCVGRRVVHLFFRHLPYLAEPKEAEEMRWPVAFVTVPAIVVSFKLRDVPTLACRAAADDGQDS